MGEFRSPEKLLCPTGEDIKERMTMKTIIMRYLLKLSQTNGKTHFISMAFPMNPAATPNNPLTKKMKKGCKRKVPQIEWHDKKATNAVHTTAFIT